MSNHANQNEYFPWPSDNPGPWASVWLEAVGQRRARHYYANPKPAFFCLHLICKGTIRFQTTNGTDKILGPGDLFSIWPQHAYCFFPEPSASNKEIVIDWIRLKGPLARAFIRTMGTTEQQPWNRANAPAKARTLMRKLQKLAADYPPGAEMYSLAILHELAAACSLNNPCSQSQQTFAHKVRSAMESQVASGMNVEQFARAFKTSRSNLFLKFKEAFGQSPTQVISEIRMRHAKILLSSTDIPIATVALASGFTDPLYFSRHFRKYTGMSPTQFRKKDTRAYP